MPFLGDPHDKARSQYEKLINLINREEMLKNKQQEDFEKNQTIGRLVMDERGMPQVESIPP